MSVAENISSAAPSANVLSVNNIEVVYDHVILVLKGVSLDVPRGGIVALLGANGAGKTTTLKAISNLLHSERGEACRASLAAAPAGRPPPRGRRPSGTRCSEPRARRP